MIRKQLVACLALLVLAGLLSACHRGPPGPGHLVPAPGHLPH
jgi:hypothetical protein